MTECIAVGDFADNIDLSIALISTTCKRSGLGTLFDEFHKKEYEKASICALGRKATLALGGYKSFLFMQNVYFENNPPLVANSINL